MLSEKNLKKQRPINLDLRTIHFPATAIASILHRISGVIMLISVGILLWLLGCSLSSPEGFARTSEIMHSFIVKFVIWGILTALAYHLLGGLRHLLMEIGWLPETQKSGTLSAWVTFILTLFLSLLAGIFLW